MRIGYARVSTDEQSLDLQLDALKKAGCKRVFTDKASAVKGDRPGLADAVSHLRSGDVLVIWKLDRLGRTVKGLVEFVADLQEQGVQFRSLTDGIDTTTPAGRFFFHVMASLAQMERELMAERTRAGLDAARRRGRVGGRKRRMTPGKVESARKLLKGGMAPRDVAQNLGVSIPTLYRWVPAASLDPWSPSISSSSHPARITDGARCHERRDPHPLGDRAGRPEAAEQLLPLVYDELRKLAAPEAGPGEAGPDPPGHGPGPRGLPPAGRTPSEPGAGTAGATSSPPRPRRCGGSWSTAPAASGARSTGGDRRRVDLDEAGDAIAPPVDDLLALDEALDEARRRGPRPRPSW